jgi:hypothetical protein
MRTVISFLLLAITIGSSAQSPDETAIRNVLADPVSAWNSGDIDNFMKAYWQNDSLTFIGRDGLTHGYNATLQRYKTNYNDTVKMGKLAYELLSIKKLSPEYYFVTGKWNLTRSIGDVGGV